ARDQVEKRVSLRVRIAWPFLVECFSPLRAAGLSPQPVQEETYELLGPGLTVPRQRHLLLQPGGQHLTLQPNGQQHGNGGDECVLERQQVPHLSLSAARQKQRLRSGQGNRAKVGGEEGDQVSRLRALAGDVDLQPRGLIGKGQGRRVGQVGQETHSL